MNFAQVLIGLEAKTGDVLVDSSKFFWKVTVHGIQAVQDCAMYIPGSVLAHIPAPNGLRKLVKKKVKRWRWAFKISSNIPTPEYCYPTIRCSITDNYLSEDEASGRFKSTPDKFKVEFWKLEGTEIEEEVEDVHS